MSSVCLSCFPKTTIAYLVCFQFPRKFTCPSFLYFLCEVEMCLALGGYICDQGSPLINPFIFQLCTNLPLPHFLIKESRFLAASSPGLWVSFTIRGFLTCFPTEQFLWRLMRVKKFVSSHKIKSMRLGSW